MPIKKDGTGKRWVEMDVLMPASVEQVWQAVATGPGNAAWVTRAEIEPRVGGALRFHFGDADATAGEITTWEAPHQFGYVERGWNGDAPPVFTEITVGPRDDGKSRLRMIHWLFSANDEWDSQLEDFENGWPSMFEVLRVYLRHAAGKEASSCLTMRSGPADALTAWQALVGKLGVAGADVGERRETTHTPEPLAGVVARVHQSAEQRYALLHLDAPSPGVALFGVHGKQDGSTLLSFSRYYYGDGAARLASDHEPRWREWLEKLVGEL